MQRDFPGRDVIGKAERRSAGRTEPPLGDWRRSAIGGSGVDPGQVWRRHPRQDRKCTAGRAPAHIAMAIVHSRFACDVEANPAAKTSAVQFHLGSSPMSLRFGRLSNRVRAASFIWRKRRPPSSVPVPRRRGFAHGALVFSSAAALRPLLSATLRKMASQVQSQAADRLSSRFGFDEAMGRKRLLFAIRPGCSVANLRTRKARWEATPKQERLPKRNRHRPRE